MQDERILRIKKMEEYFDALLAAGEAAGSVPEYEAKLFSLREYYIGGLWLSDYEADERGELPADLKRGVLSQDGLHNLLDNYKAERCTVK